MWHYGAAAKDFQTIERSCKKKTHTRINKERRKIHVVFCQILTATDIPCCGGFLRVIKTNSCEAVTYTEGFVSHR